MGRWWHARRACGQSNAGGAARESCAGKREDRCFSFSRGKDQEMLSLPSGQRQQQERSYRSLRTQAPPRKWRVRGLWLGVETQLVAACGLRSSLSSLYTLDTYVRAQSGRNGWMSVFSSLCIYSISQILAVVKNGKWKKMEGVEKSGRRGIAGDGYAERCAWEGMERRLGGCHLRFSS